MPQGKKRSGKSSSLEERIADQRRLLALQLAVLDKQDFVKDALKALADVEDAGEPWDELKAELGLARLPKSST